MATEIVNSGIVKSFVASGSIGKNQPVELGTGTNDVKVVNASTDTVIGFALYDAVDGQEVAISLVASTKKMQAVGAITRGAYVGLDTGSPTKIASITLNASGTTYKQTLGLALEASTGADAFIEVLQLNALVLI
jgi:FlaG/FlaF family flagellin (archaellin)